MNKHDAMHKFLLASEKKGLPLISASQAFLSGLTFLYTLSRDITLSAEKDTFIVADGPRIEDLTEDELEMMGKYHYWGYNLRENY